MQEYFIKRSISDDLLKEHFLGMISELFSGIAAKDEQAVRKVTETTFADKLIEQFASRKTEVKYTKPADDAIDKCYLIDKLFIQGISTHRHLNDWNTDYVVQKDLEQKGLRTYLHKFHLGYMPYYFKRDYQQQYERLATADLEQTERYSLSMQMRKSIHEQRKRLIDNRF